MDFIKELKEKAKKIDLNLEISGSKKTKTFFKVNLRNPDKVVSSREDKKFELLIDYYIANNKDGDYRKDIGGFRFIFKKGGYKIVITSNYNGYDYMMLFKEN